MRGLIKGCGIVTGIITEYLDGTNKGLTPLENYLVLGMCTVIVLAQGVMIDQWLVRLTRN